MNRRRICNDMLKRFQEKHTGELGCGPDSIKGIPVFATLDQWRAYGAWIEERLSTIQRRKAWQDYNVWWHRASRPDPENTTSS